MDTNPNTELMSALAMLLTTGKYSDLTIVCKQREYAVHRAIVCSRSDFFDAACGRSGFREAETGRIDLSEEDEEAVGCLVSYFYHLDYLSTHLSRRSSQKSRQQRRRRGLPSPSLSTSPPISPINPMDSVRTTATTATGSPWRTQQQQRKRLPKLNMASIDDPLLAQASATSPVPGTGWDPLTPPGEEVVPGLYGIMRKEEEDYDDDDDDQSDDEMMDDGAFSTRRTKYGRERKEGSGLSIDMNNFTTTTTFHAGAGEQSHLVTHARVYALAEKYNIASLKTLSRQKFSSLLNHHYQQQQSRSHSRTVTTTTTTHDSSFPDALAEVYESTVESDRGLRDVVLQVFRSHPEVARRRDVDEVVRMVPQLAGELERVARGLPVGR